MDYTIVDARPEHLDALETLEQLCFSMPWDRATLASQLPDTMHVFLVAVDASGAVQGYVGMMHVLDEGYISNVAVAPSVRRQGIGDGMIEELLRRAKALELAFVTLEVREHNEPAQALYRKHGFMAVGKRRNYYQAPVEDAVLMTKAFG